MSCGFGADSGLPCETICEGADDVPACLLECKTDDPKSTTTASGSNTTLWFLVAGLAVYLLAGRN